MVKKERIGIVVSNKPEKTIIVAIQTRYQHPKYNKTLIKTKRYMAHDEQNECKSGDLVLVEESPPISRNKRWKLKEILKIYQK
jgi:small subunit ribosomal protein S17